MNMYYACHAVLSLVKQPFYVIHINSSHIYIILMYDVLYYDNVCYVSNIVPILATHFLISHVYFF